MRYWGKIGRWLKEFSYCLELRIGGQFEENANYYGIFSFFGGEFVTKNRVLL
jgi:hypothetical protein